MLFKWLFTVFALIPSCRAISLFRRPRAIPSAICCSLRVSCSRGLGIPTGYVVRCSRVSACAPPIGPDLAARHGSNRVKECFITELFRDKPGRAGAEHLLDVLVRGSSRDDQDTGVRRETAESGNDRFRVRAQRFVVEQKEVGGRPSQNVNDLVLSVPFANDLESLLLLEAGPQHIANESWLGRNCDPHPATILSLTSGRRRGYPADEPVADASFASAAFRAPRSGLRGVLLCHRLALEEPVVGVPLDLLEARLRGRTASSMRETPQMAAVGALICGRM
jgi:hypothetical protein